jgi:hypothetical protein
VSTAPIVVERHARRVYRLRHGRFLLAAVLPIRGRAVMLAASLARVLCVELRYRSKLRAAPVPLAGQRARRYRS